jgi:SNF2 family DNA or RNA helicase
VHALEASLKAAAAAPQEAHGGKRLSKLDELVRICEAAHASKEKTLVFGEFAALLNELQSELARRSVPTVDTDGGTAQKMTEAFRRFSAADGGVNVMLCHSTMFSCGVNLEATAHIVLVHRLEPALRVQVVGRAQRPGRAGPLAITTLLYPGE